MSAVIRATGMQPMDKLTGKEANDNRPHMYVSKRHELKELIKEVDAKCRKISILEALNDPTR
jgi:hypothetical protein